MYCKTIWVHANCIIFFKTSRVRRDSTPVGIVDKVADNAIEVDVTILVDNPSVVGDDRDRRDGVRP